jgi:hypothetical protein
MLLLPHRIETNAFLQQTTSWRIMLQGRELFGRIMHQRQQVEPGPVRYEWQPAQRCRVQPGRPVQHWSVLLGNQELPLCSSIQHWPPLLEKRCLQVQLLRQPQLHLSTSLTI